MSDLKRLSKKFAQLLQEDEFDVDLSEFDAEKNTYSAPIRVEQDEPTVVSRIPVPSEFPESGVRIAGVADLVHSINVGLKEVPLKFNLEQWTDILEILSEARDDLETIENMVMKKFEE